MTEKAYIWGSGRYGKAAREYYKNYYEIFGYIDSDERKWNQRIEGVEVFSPDILVQNKYHVIIAMKTGVEEIAAQIKNKYKIYSYSVFGVKETFPSRNEDKHKKEIQDKNAVIIRFSGGLGNQLFQYAVYKCFEKIGKAVFADLTYYDKFYVMSFRLQEVFENIKLHTVTKNEETEWVQRIMSKEMAGKYLYYLEPKTYDVHYKTADMDILNISGGIISGLFQSRQFAGKVEKELLKDICFKRDTEEKLMELTEIFKAQKIIGVHVRRGDYLIKDNIYSYGNICTEEYYNNAISYITNRCPGYKICFFSDDIEWVKENFDIKGAMYVESNMFEHYQDWYDMYLMSLCKHNIIANSTFSWWGAWLNQNPNKTVIAPKKWVNQCEYLDIYPEDWICM